LVGVDALQVLKRETMTTFRSRCLCAGSKVGVVAFSGDHPK
jgi:hypothetical protein